MLHFSGNIGGEGANHIAALMALTIIAHTADSDSGLARITYDHFCATTLLSRAKISRGLDVLERIKVIDREPEDAPSALAG